MHCIPLFFQRKTLYINCVQNRIFPNIWGAKCITGPQYFLWGPWPPGPHVADPMIPTVRTPFEHTSTFNANASVSGLRYVAPSVYAARLRYAA